MKASEGFCVEKCEPDLPLSKSASLYSAKDGHTPYRTSVRNGTVADRGVRCRHDEFPLPQPGKCALSPAAAKHPPVNAVYIYIDIYKW